MTVTLFGLFRLPYVPGIRVFGQRVTKELAEDNQRVYFVLGRCGGGCATGSSKSWRNSCPLGAF